MSHRPPVLAALLALAAPTLAQHDPKETKEVQVYDEQADARQQVAAALVKAKRDNQRVLIQWGANWCGWCKWLAGTMKKDRDVAHELLYEYQVVHVDVGHFDKHVAFAKELGADFQAIPHLTILDADGKALAQQNTEPFEIHENDTHGHDPAKLLAFLKRHEATPLAAQAVLAAAVEQAKQSGRSVFLHFGAPWCGWCHRLEHWMAQPEIAELLAKDFVDLKIDNDRMQGGKETYEATLAKAGRRPTGIPWFVFLDGDGAILIDSTGPGGNCGFPYQPDEVEHFGAMLKKAQRHLGDDEIARLVQSLHDNRERDAAKRAAQERERAAPPKAQPLQPAGGERGSV